MMRGKLGMKSIWQPQGARHEVEICCRDRVEDKFVEVLVEMIAEVLKINYKDRAVFMGVLRTAIEDDTKDMLGQFLNGSMDELIRSFNYEFGVDAKPSYDYAPHAKLSDAIDMVIKKYDIKVDRGNVADKTRAEESGKR